MRAMPRDERNCLLLPGSINRGGILNIAVPAAAYVAWGATPSDSVHL